MAKSIKSTTRVHLLATELGVKSSAIVEKCQAEGLDIKNHMATISAGLAATIREWFSDGVHSTTIEVANRVDLSKVRVKRKKTKADDSAQNTAPTDANADVMIDQETIEEAAEGAVAKQETTETEPDVTILSTAEAGGGAVIGEPAETAGYVDAAQAVQMQAGTETTAVQAARIQSEPEQKTQVEPEVVMPAGPMMGKPTPAQLTGPTVVRVEAVEPDEVRRRGRGRVAPPPRTDRGRYNAPISEPLMLSAPDTMTAGKGKKAGKDKSRGKKRNENDIEDEGVTKPKGTIKRMRARDMEERQARLAAASGESLRLKPSRRIETKRSSDSMPSERPLKATITEPIMVRDLATVLVVKVSDVVEKLIKQGLLATANQVIASDVAELIAIEFGTELIVERKHSLQEQIEADFAAKERKNLQKRPPIVTMLGHVDHGKTSLLDRIRSTSVASGEAGGITQHIGAYMVDFEGRKVTFLDTPGHEAFTAMRARGANMTDIAVLVVAADDGLMPQTIEAIHHAQAAGVEIVVALNKIDLPGINLHRIYGQLAEHGLAPIEWSGTTDVVKTSATTGEGVEDLIEHLDYIAELKDYKADSTIPAQGWVVEAKMTTTQGPVATLLVREGQFRKGDIILAGCAYGHVRAIKDSWGRTVRKATSSMAVEISGLCNVPLAGDKFFCLEDPDLAKQAAEQNQVLSREKSLVRRSQITLDNLFSQIAAGNIKELNLIIRADVQGSVDVLMKYLSQLSTDEVKVKILHAAVGGITEGDVVLAEASGAIVIGFNAVPDDKVRMIAESKGVDIRLYNIIYRITEDLKAAMTGLLDPEYQEKHLGRLVVRNTFKISSVGTIAGCYATSGVILKNSKVRLIRNNIVVKDNCVIESLKHFKDDAKEIKTGFECGVNIANFDDIKVDDVLESYEIVEVARKL